MTESHSTKNDKARRSGGHQISLGPPYHIWHPLFSERMAALRAVAEAYERQFPEGGSL